MSKIAQPYQKWVADCPEKDCKEQLHVEHGINWIWCPICDKDWDLNVEVIRDHEDSNG